MTYKIKASDRERLRILKEQMGIRPGKPALFKPQKHIVRIIGEPTMEVDSEEDGGKIHAPRVRVEHNEKQFEVLTTELLTMEMVPDVLKHLKSLPTNGGYIKEVQGSVTDAILILEAARDDSIEIARSLTRKSTLSD